MMSMIEIERIADDFENENKPPIKSIDKSKCTECETTIITTNEGLRVCPHCGIVYDTLFVTERYSPVELSYDKYRKNKPYNRYKHLLKLIRKINCTRNSDKDDFNVDETIKERNIKTNDNIDVIKTKIGNYRKNQYILMKKLHNDKYILIDEFLIEKIKVLYNMITNIYFNKLKKNNRTNFINNYFILKKILIRLNRADIADKIHNLKVEKNRMKYENIWNEIQLYL
jgi:hypothetical protein